MNTLITEAGPGRAHLTCKATSPGKVASDALGAGLGSGRWRGEGGWCGVGREVGAPRTWTVRRPGRALRGAVAWGAGACGARRRRPGARPAGAQPVAFAAGGSVLCLAQGHGSATPVASLHGERHRPHSRALRSRRVCCCFSPAPAAAPAADRPLGAAAARMRIRWEAPRRCVSWAMRGGGCVGLAARPHGAFSHGESGRYYR